MVVFVLMRACDDGDEICDIYLDKRVAEYDAYAPSHWVETREVNNNVMTEEGIMSKDIAVEMGLVKK
jgi:hypothetical protein